MEFYSGYTQVLPSASSTRRTTPTFMGIPRELRLKILEFLLPIHRHGRDLEFYLQGVDILGYDRCIRPRTHLHSYPAILRTSRQLYEEGLAFLYKSQNVRINAGGLVTPPFLQHVGSAGSVRGWTPMRHVQRLVIDFVLIPSLSARSVLARAEAVVSAIGLWTSLRHFTILLDIRFGVMWPPYLLELLMILKWVKVPDNACVEVLFYSFNMFSDYQSLAQTLKKKIEIRQQQRRSSK